MNIGDKRTLKRDVVEPACGDHPAFLMGREGEVVKIVDITERKDYSILVEGEKTNIGKPWWASEDDFSTEEN